MKILVTGWTGFIGGKTFEELVERGFDAVKFEGDIRKVNDWKRHFEGVNGNHLGGVSVRGVNVIFHCAGIRTDAEKDFVVNVGGVQAMFEAIKKTEAKPSRIVFVSTQAVYEGVTPPFTEGMTVQPTTIYGKSKLEAEEIVLQEAKQQSILPVILRYSTVLGSGIRKKSSMSGPLARWTERGIKGEPIEVYQDVNRTRNYVHIEDVVSANLLAIESLPEGIYNVGGIKAESLLTFAKSVKKETGDKSEIVIKDGMQKNSDLTYQNASMEKLLSHGWKPQFTLEDAVRDYVESVNAD